MKITDLTWQQIADALGSNSKIFLGEDPDGNIGVLISVAGINDEIAPSMNTDGVVKCLSRLRDAAYKAQSTANSAEGITQPLAAFPAATTSSNVENGYVIQSGTIDAAIKVSSATEVVGVTGFNSKDNL